MSFRSFFANKSQGTTRGAVGIFVSFDVLAIKISVLLYSLTFRGWAAGNHPTSTLFVVWGYRLRCILGTLQVRAVKSAQ